MNLTKNFTLEEMEHSYTANNLKIVNTAPLEAVANLKALCENVLQPLRDWYGRPIYVTSGYRCTELNKAVGGVTNSQHKVGEAADIQPPLSPPSAEEVCLPSLRPQRHSVSAINASFAPKGEDFDSETSLHLSSKQSRFSPRGESEGVTRCTSPQNNIGSPLRGESEGVGNYYTELKRIWTHIRDTMDFDQCILEHSGTTYWIHISWKRDASKNRKKAFFLEKK